MCVRADLGVRPVLSCPVYLAGKDIIARPRAKIFSPAYNMIPIRILQQSVSCLLPGKISFSGSPGL